MDFDFDIALIPGGVAINVGKIYVAATKSDVDRRTLLLTNVLDLDEFNIRKFTTSPRVKNDCHKSWV